MTGVVVKCGLGALITSILALILKETRTEWGTVCGLIGGVMISLSAFTLLESLLSAASAFVGKSGIEKDQLTAILKCIGLCFLVDFTAGFCRNAGQASLAAALELVGKVCLCVLCLPFALELLDLVQTVLTA